MNYLTFYAKDKSIRQVTVTSATEQSDEVYSAVRQLVAKAFDNSAEVEMTKKSIRILSVVLSFKSTTRFMMQASKHN
jgi:F0F1-type ATP synthase delta subunit